MQFCPFLQQCDTAAAGLQIEKVLSVFVPSGQKQFSLLAKILCTDRIVTAKCTVRVRELIMIKLREPQGKLYTYNDRGMLGSL